MAEMVDAVETTQVVVELATKGQGQTRATVRIYPPSWLNRLRIVVGTLPGPNWAYYLGPCILLIAMESGLRWYEEIDPPGTINAFFAANALIIGGMLILLEHLDRVACSALERFRPVLVIEGMLSCQLPDTPGAAGQMLVTKLTRGQHAGLNNAQYESLCYQLTNLPARPTFLISATAALAMSLQAITGSVTYFQPAGLYMAPLSGIVDLLMAMLIASMLGVFTYHTIWQLRLMHGIYTDHTRVRLFDASPIYAFSRLTARTAIALVLLAYAEILVLPEAWRTHPSLGGLAHYGLIVGTILIAIVTFVWPLLGVHQLLVDERERRQMELAQRMDAAIGELQRPLESGELGHVEVTRRKEILDTLVLAENEIQKISTWPWRTRTVGGLVTTILLPLLIWFITRLLGHVIP